MEEIVVLCNSWLQTGIMCTMDS